MNSLTAAFAFSMIIGDNEICVGVVDEEYVNQVVCVEVEDSKLYE